MMVRKQILCLRRREDRWKKDLRAAACIFYSRHYVLSECGLIRWEKHTIIFRTAATFDDAMVDTAHAENSSCMRRGRGEKEGTKGAKKKASTETDVRRTNTQIERLRARMSVSLSRF